MKRNSYSTNTKKINRNLSVNKNDTDYKLDNSSISNLDISIMPKKKKTGNEKSWIDKEISNLSCSRVNMLNHSKRKNGLLTTIQAKKNIQENNILKNYLIKQKNYCWPNHNGKFRPKKYKMKSSKDFDFYSNSNSIKFSFINFNNIQIGSSLGDKNMEKSKFSGLQKDSQKSLNIYQIRKINNKNSHLNLSKDYFNKERKSANLELEPQGRKSFNIINFPNVLPRKSKQSDYLHNSYFYKPRKSKQSEMISNNSNRNSLNNFDFINNNNKIKLMKMNQNIQKAIDSKQLKKRIKLMKKSIILFQKELNFEDDEDYKIKRTEDLVDKNKSKFKEEENDEENQTYIKSKSKLIEEEENNGDNKKNFRSLKRVNELYDSLDDEEYEDQAEFDYYISPSNNYIKIFDVLIFFCSMIYLIYVPYLFSYNTLIAGESAKLALIIIDIIYILDLILNFFRAYQNFDENLVKKTKFIFVHYLKTWFFMDLIQSIPFFTLFKYIDFKNSQKYDFNIYDNHNNSFKYLIILVKIIKLYKLVQENTTLSTIGKILAQNETIDNYGSFLFSIFYSICSINLTACIFIFVGKNSYPGWIMKINMHDEPYLNIYITSIYFILVTITTVGYGDITGGSNIELIYQMFLLIIGTFAYSFIISFFSNYIVKINQKSITFEKNLNILEEIRLHHPNLKNRIYQEVLKNLKNEQLYEKNDKSLLFDCLPITLKNKLIMEMYKEFIDHFIFFKRNDNSDFIVKVVTSLKPLLSFKGDKLIQEGDFVKEIFFVKKGVLVLNITIDKENPEESIRKYLEINEDGTINISYVPHSLLGENGKKNDLNLYERVNTYFLNKATKSQITLFHQSNLTEIKIIEVNKNEHFGDALMFLNERSPLVLKVKTKTSELLVLRKMEAIEIYSIYPHIWMRINKKSIFNMEEIKRKIKKELYKIAKKYGTLEEKEILKKSKTIKRYSILTSPRNSTANSTKLKSKNPKKKSVTEKEKIKININGESKDIFEANKASINNEIFDKNITFKQISNTNKSTTKSSIKSKIKSNINEKESSQFKSKNKDVEKCVTFKIDNSTPERTGIAFSKNYSKKSLNKLKSKKTFNNLKSQKSFKTQKSFQTQKSLNKSKISKGILKVEKSAVFGDEENNSSNDVSKESNNKANKEKINSFSNLSTTNEKSFQLDSIYENINKITDNKYSKSIPLQSKTKRFLLNECLDNNNNSCKLVNKNYQSKVISKFNSIKSIKNNFDFGKNEKSVNSLNSIEINSNKSDNDTIEQKAIKNKNFNEDNKEKDKVVVKPKRIDSVMTNFNLKLPTISDNDCSIKKVRCKSPKKKKVGEIFVNKKLDLINQNIKGANKNINNPEEFYMDFFNDIIRKGTIEIKEEKVINKAETFKKTLNFSYDSKKGINKSKSNLKIAKLKNQG